MSNLQGWDPAWERVFREQEWGKYPQEHVIRFVARHFRREPHKPPARLLDLGCGPGACTWFMAREGFEVAAIDGSATAILQATARLAGESLRADFRNGDYLQLPWDDGYFDGVIENVTFYCNRFESILAARDEVVRVLKPGGVSCPAISPTALGAMDWEIRSNLMASPTSPKGLSWEKDSR